MILGVEATQGDKVAPGARVTINTGLVEFGTREYEEIRHRYASLLLMRALSGLDLARVTVDTVRIFEVVLPGPSNDAADEMFEHEVMTYRSPEAPKIAVVPAMVPKGPRRE